MIELYLNSLIFIFLGSIFIIPLIIFKGFSRYATLLFYFILLGATISRPYLLGIDNANFIKDLTEREYFSNDFSKYRIIYFITYLIPGTWQKLFGLNLISTFITIFSLKKIFKSIQYESKTKYTILLYMTYTLVIASPLILIHARQYFCFSIILILLNLYRSSKRWMILYEITLSFILFSIHPVYTSFLCFYFICKYFIRKIINFIYTPNNLSKLTIPALFIFNNINYFYTYLTENLEGFLTYGVQLNLGKNPNPNIFSKFYLLIFILPILIIFINSEKNNDSRILFSVLLTYIFFSVPFIFLEFKLSTLYAISRVKSGFYPAIFIVIYHLENLKINKKIMLYGTLSLTLFNVYSTLRFYQRF